MPMKKAEIVVISTPGIGNLVPAVEFATYLTNTDPRLTATILLIPLPQRPLVNSYILSRTTAQNIKFLHLPQLDPPSPDQYISTIGFLSLLIQNYKTHVKNALTKLTPPLAALFVDMFCTPMIDIANQLNIPCYLYFASPASFFAFMLHLPILDSTEFEESKTELTIPGFSNPVPKFALPTFFLNRNDDGYSWFLHHAKRYKETKGIVINTFLELEPFALNSLSSSSDCPPVYPIGPVLDHVGPAEWDMNRVNHEKIMKWLDQQPLSSVVFLSFGSMGSLRGDQVREIALGLERSGCRFLWCLREAGKGKLDLPGDYENIEEVLPDGFVERTGGIGLVCGWASQVSILGHKAVGGFVSHCGWNSILESLWYGVPVATWPLYAEQQMNAFEMVKELKLAVEIRLDYRLGSEVVLAEEVERGVRSLMDSDCEVRKKVKEMSERSRRAMMENGSAHKSLGCLIEELMGQI